MAAIQDSNSNVPQMIATSAEYPHPASTIAAYHGSSFLYLPAMPSPSTLVPSSIPPAPLAQHARFVQRIRRRYAQELPLLPTGLPTPETMTQTLAQLRQQHDCGSALRILRHLVLERLAVLDCEAGTPMQDVALVMTQLAELVLDVAMQEAYTQLDTRHGAPLKADGTRCNCWIVGMGKLGARELNVSSDIDLIYIYECDGDTAGRADSGAGRVSFQKYFARAVRHVHTLVGEVTEHGQVFRIDLALRPNGNSGPSTCSLDALEEYFQVQGREWERFAWLKSRVVAPRASIDNASAQQLRRIVLPFVFRKYLDYNVFDSLRLLHRQIRSHARQRSASHPERANDVKLGRGGIREIEFTVQLLQVVRGGTFPELRTRPTLDALHRLHQAGLMPQTTAQQLCHAYIFLRQLEHRIQYLDDQQTHTMPTADADLQWIAHSMGLADIAALQAQLQTHRTVVEREFDALLGADHQHAPSEDIAQSDDDIGSLLALLGTTPPPSELATRLHYWREHARVQALQPAARMRLMKVMQRGIQWMQEDTTSHTITQVGMTRFVDWIETLLRRESYLALLLERPAVHERLLRLLSLAKWPAQYLIQHPGVIDELTSNAMLEERFDADTFCADMQRRLEALQRTAEDDEESQLNLLRRAMHAEVFRTLARDLDGRLTVEEVADDLSHLADAVLNLTIRWCWQHYLPRARRLGWTGWDTPIDSVTLSSTTIHAEHASAAEITADIRSDITAHGMTNHATHLHPDMETAARADGEGAKGGDIADHLAVIAYGKLGGLELGYGSDLDVVFVYDDAHHPQAGEIYAGFVRKLITWLTVKTGEGDLYEIDTALRPNGNSGLLCSDFAAYADYQLQRGSNTAWVWEHQAMTRARCCFGSDALRQRFEHIRTAVLTAQRDEQALKQEIIAMRQRMRQAHPSVPGTFDIKHDAGGMVDIEFVTQYLVLHYSRQYPVMLENRGNIALLERADDLGILPVPHNCGHAAAHAYRDLRRLQHRARLDEESTQFAQEAVSAQAQAGQTLWQAVFGTAPPTNHGA